MINNNYIQSLIDEYLDGTDMFLIKLKVSTDNKIIVIIDGDNGVTIDDCVGLSRQIEGNLDRDKEDFELSVSSAGIDKPYLLLRQYIKNIGKLVKIITNESKTLKGILVSASAESVEIKEEIVSKNKKHKKSEYGDIITIQMSDIKETKSVVTF